jgi:hypothetical protein
MSSSLASPSGAFATRASRVSRARSRPVRVSASSTSRGDAVAPPPRIGRRSALASTCFSLALAAGRANADATLSTFDEDTADMIARQRALLSKGEGDVEAYCAKADAYFAGYKWDHKGHTNSFSALMSNDIVIREQKDYLDAQGLAWTPESVPARDTPKGKVLEGYLGNVESCIRKEAFGPFNAMTPEQRKEWKAITCTQGLVAPAE